MGQLIGIAQVSTANTARDGTGTIATLFTAPDTGAAIQRVEVVATGTTTAGVIRLFINDGTNTRLWDEVLVTAITPSTTIEVWSGSVTPAPYLPLKPNWSLRASTHNAETFNLTAYAFV